MNEVCLKKLISEDFARPISGYDGYYATRFGLIISNNWMRGVRIMTNVKHESGYLIVTIRKNKTPITKRVHQLIALAFIPNPNEYPIINHKDENKLNSKVSNLEWCTHKYNINYGTALKRRADAQRNKVRSSIRVARCNDDFDVIEVYPSINEAVRKGYKYVCIKGCCEGLSRYSRHAGFKWKYL